MNNRYFAIRVRRLSLPHGKQDFRNRRGNATPHKAMVFTLIELMLVITIISILAALLLPVLKRAKAVAWTSVCANNLKQHSFSVVNFADEHEDYMPCSQWRTKQAAYADVLFPSDDQFASPNHNYSWDSTLSGNCFWPYLQPMQKTLCPAHPKYSPPYTGQSWQTYRMNTKYMSFSTTTTLGTTVRKRFSQVPHPSELFLFVDGLIGGDNWGMACDMGGNSFQKIGFHHNGNTGFNANYFDGHVAFLRLNHTPLTSTDPPLTANFQ